MLVDGQQRITTLFQYFTDSRDLRLSTAIPKYSELDEVKQIEFLEYKVVVRDLGNLPIEDIKKVFERINSTSYGLNAMELNNSRYSGAFKDLAVWMSEQKSIERLQVFSANDIRRMNDVRFCLSAIASILGPYFNRDKDLESYLSKYDESIPNESELRVNIQNTLDAIDKMNFPTGSRATKKADFFSLFVELYRCISTRRMHIDIAAARSGLDDFYADVDKASADDSTDAGKYYKASLQASNDRSSRIARGEMISKILEGSAKSTGTAGR